MEQEQIEVIDEVQVEAEPFVWSSAILEQKYFSDSSGNVFCIDVMASNSETWPEEVADGWHEISKEIAQLMTTPPDGYHTWDGKSWVMTDESNAQKQIDTEAIKQAEIAALLTYAAQKINEYQDLVDFAETAEELAIGEQGYSAWRQYRANLLKYQKGLALGLPTLPE